MHARVDRERNERTRIEDPAIHPVRRLLFALVAAGALGLIVELFLLEHTESVYQWLPLLVLFLAAPGALVLVFRPTPVLLRAFRALMSIALLIGGLGIYLHYRGNTEFELEMDPALQGFDLFWSALRGATPALAPGALAQLGLVGLVSLYRHPLLRRPARAAFTTPGAGAPGPQQERSA